MKTAMQELIEKLEIEANSISDNDHIEDRCWRNGVRRSLNIAKEHLDKEKEQIIDAYYGKIDGVLGYREEGEEYYNQTYMQHGLDNEARDMLNNYKGGHPDIKEI